MKLFILMLSLFLLVSQEKKTAKHKVSIVIRTDTTQTVNPAIPPADLLEQNYVTATHIAVIDIDTTEIADKIYADDGKLGYIVQKSTGRLLNVYKGDFGKKNEVIYYNFLEYSPELKKLYCDTALVFLKKDLQTNKFMAIEVGQFKYSRELIDVLIEIVEKNTGKGFEKK